VQISVVEQVDVGHRGGYYDQAGVLRDMFQNHLLQLLCLTALEPPSSFKADDLRNEKVKVLSAIRPIDLNDVVVGQYEGYCDLPDVRKGSQTPTYAALRLFIDNWRWTGVPFYLRSGKALKEKVSEVTIEFKCPPKVMFAGVYDKDFKPNLLSLRIQPDEGVRLAFEVKEPDTFQNTTSAVMDFNYRDLFNKHALPEAYERLLLDAIKGDASLFSRHDEIELAWQIIDPVIHAVEDPKSERLTSYTPGSWGPESALELLNREGREWRLCCFED
jgi:glucose-6-phosphate 1-dehydrogenase